MNAAKMILEARQARRVLAPLGAAAPADAPAAYAVQRELADMLGAVPPGGFKIGATTRQMQEYLGLSGPAAGFVPKTSLNASGLSVPFADFIGVGVECEVAVRLGADLPPAPAPPNAPVKRWRR